MKNDPPLSCFMITDQEIEARAIEFRLRPIDARKTTFP